MRLMTLIKLVKLFVLWSESDPLPVTDTSTDTPCPPEVERLVTTVSVTSEITNLNSLLPNTTSKYTEQHVNSANSGDVDNDSQSDCHSDSDSCAPVGPEVMVSDARVFSSIKNEQKYPWLYDSVAHQGYLCKFCELFCGHTSSSQEFVTVGINLGAVWSLFYYWTSKLINLLLFPSFHNSHHLWANFTNYKGHRPQIQMSRKITGMTKMSAHGHMRTSDSPRKRKRKEVLENFNKTRINIHCVGHQHDRWMELMEVFRV